MSLAQQKQSIHKRFTKLGGLLNGNCQAYLGLLFFTGFSTIIRIIGLHFDTVFTGNSDAA